MTYPKSSIFSTAANNEASGFIILMAGIRSSKNKQPYDFVAFTKLMYKIAPEEKEVGFEEVAKQERTRGGQRLNFPP